MKKILIVLALVLSGVAGAQSGAASSKGYEELTSRLLGFGFNLPEIVVGQLPKLGFELPIPEGARVLGYIKQGSGEYSSYEIVMDAKQKPKDVMAFFQSKLSKPWEVKSRGNAFGSSIFQVPNMGQDEGDEFMETKLCRKAVALSSISVSAFNNDTPISDVHVRVDSYSCGEDASVSLDGLPKLLTPTNAEVMGMSTMVGTGLGLISQVNLQTKSNAFDLHEYFASEMQRNNWTKLAATMLGPIPQSLWGFKDTSGKDHLLTLACREVAPNTVACLVFVLQ